MRLWQGNKLILCPCLQIITRLPWPAAVLQVRENVPKGKSLKHAYINSPYRNFFKHADNDTDRTLEPLPYSQLEGVLFLAVEDYIRLNRQSPVQLQVYQLWYLAKHPEKLDPDVAGSLKDDITRIFPNLYAISRTDQIALGAGLLLNFLNDEEIKKDLRTECAFE